MESIRSWRRTDRDSGAEVAAAAGEPDVHGGFSARDDGAGEGAEVQFVDVAGRRQRKAFAGGVDDLFGAVVPGFQLGAAELGIGLAQAVELGHRCHGHGIGQFNEGRAGRFQDGFAGRAQPELLKCRVQEAERHRGEGRLGAAEVVEERAAGDPGGVGDVLHREVSGSPRAEQVHGGVRDGLPGGRLVQFAARGDDAGFAGAADGGGRGRAMGRHALTLRACLHSGQVFSRGGLRARALRRQVDRLARGAGLVLGSGMAKTAVP